MQKWLLLIVIVLAFTLRVFNLSQHPAGFTPDEASFGYDAYSLIETGRDQWGNPWPLVFKSFGDYKLPLYGYLSMPFVALFGLSEVAVRLPNAILGTVAVYVTYLLVSELQKKGALVRNHYLSLLSALLVAISPWHVPMSRGAFEANITTLLLPLGVWAFLKGIERSRYFYLSAISFGLNLFSYHSARFLTPLFVLLIVWLFRKEFTKRRGIIVPALFFALFNLVALLTIFSGAGERVSTSTIFSESGYSSTFVNRYEAVLSGAPSVLATLFNNKFVFIVNEFVQKYVSYFSMTFLWTNGPGEATYGMVPGFGVLYWFENLFLIGYLLYLLTTKLSKYDYILVGWLLLAPVPAALSIGPGFAANRAVIMLPALHIASAIGGIYVMKKMSRVLNTKVIAVSFIAGVLFSFSFFFEEYFYQQPMDGAASMMYGVSGALSSVVETEGEVLITRRLSEPHIYVAFYDKTDPEAYQVASSSWDFEQRGLKWVDQIPEYRLANYTFRTVDLRSENNGSFEKIVIVPEEYHEDLELDKTDINYPSGKPAFIVIN